MLKDWQNEDHRLTVVHTRFNLPVPKFQKTIIWSTQTRPRFLRFSNKKFAGHFRLVYAADSKVSPSTLEGTMAIVTTEAVILPTMTCTKKRAA